MHRIPTVPSVAELQEIERVSNQNVTEQEVNHELSASTVQIRGQVNQMEEE